MRTLLIVATLLLAGCSTFSGPTVYDGYTVEKEPYWCATRATDDEIFAVPCWKIQRTPKAE